MRLVERLVMFLAMASFSVSAFAADSDRLTAKPADSAHNDPVAARIFSQEAKLVENMHTYSPMVETYIQELKTDPDLGMVPQSDKYFLGRMALNDKGVRDTSFSDQQKKGFFSHFLPHFDNIFAMKYMPRGFMELVFLSHEFDDAHYELKPLRQQFLAEVRTLVFDVVPRPHMKGPYFEGRIWVEDQDYNIVLLNASYHSHAGTKSIFHFNTSRTTIPPTPLSPASH